jgi:acyl dehydratase
MDTKYFDDIAVGETFSHPAYEIPADELLEFNRKWDRLPIHLDEQAAHAAGHRTIIGSGQYTLCIKQYFVNSMPWRTSVIGAVGFDELRFRGPVHGGDRISMTIECIDKHESRSKPDRGVVKFDMNMTNQDSDPILTYTDIVMIKKRTA